MVIHKPKMMKNSIFLLATLTLFVIPYSCNKEEPLPTSAAFTTNLQNNTVTTQNGVTFYLSDATGEFLTYFRGDKPENTFETGYGTTLELGTDSLTLNYYTPGSYTFTLVATSYGNWGETVSQDIQSVDINVIAAE
jgi:hypothetical protein